MEFDMMIKDFQNEDNNLLKQLQKDPRMEIPKHKQYDPIFCLRLVENDASAYFRLNDEMKENMKICRAVALEDAEYVKDMPLSIRDNKAFCIYVLCKCANNEYVFEDFSERLRNDWDIYRLVRTSDSSIYGHIGKDVAIRLLNETEGVADRLHILNKLSERVRQNREICMIRVQCDPSDFEHLPKLWKNDKEIALMACKTRPLNVVYVSQRLVNDPDIAILNVKYAGERVLNDPAFLKKAIKVDIKLWKRLPHNLKDKELVLYLVQAYARKDKFPDKLYDIIDQSLFDDRSFLGKNDSSELFNSSI